MPSKLVSTKERSALKKNGWKDIQYKAKMKKRSKLALLILALLVGFLIVSWVIQLTQSLFSPWKLSPDQERSYVWDAQFNINLLLRGSNISVLSYHPKEERIVIINIPDETFLNVPYGFGLWQLRAVYELGESQKDSGGNKLLVETLTNFLAIPIDGFLDFSTLEPNKSASEIVDILKENPFSGFNLLSGLKTDLTIWELLRLKVSAGSVRFDKIKELSLDKIKVLDRENLLDGTPIYTADPFKLDSVLSDLADPVITSEHKSIAVLNATGQAQLAQKAARLITNLGGNVIITTNASQKLKKTQVVGLESATLKRLKQIFGSDDKIGPTDEDSISSRAQINLLLGEDYLSRN